MNKRFIAMGGAFLGLLALSGVAAASPSALPPSSSPAAPAVTIAPPIVVSPGNVGRLAASNDGSVDHLSWNDFAILAQQNPAFYTGFQGSSLDAADALGNAVAEHDPAGRIWGAWYYVLPSGISEVHYGVENPGQGINPWYVATVPGSQTSPSLTNGSYKVIDMQSPVDNHMYAMWARNGVGARVSFTLDGGDHWSQPEDVPGPINSTSGDFAMGVTTGGHIFVGWFDRNTTDFLVQMRSPSGVWGPVTDIAPVRGQAYGGKFAAAPDGGLRVIWDQISPTASQRDVWYREWTPAGGWDTHIVQLFNTSGDTSGGAYNISVDAAGTAHIVFSDNTYNNGIQQSFYMYGRGTTFTRPQAIFPQFGNASGRYPDVDANVVSTQGNVTRAHIMVNDNVTGQFKNYYTYAEVISTVTPTPTITPIPPSPTPCSANVYSDVPPNYVFYPYITDLSQRGAISGYSDCTFRPGLEVTRGQVAKIVMVATQYQLITPPNPSFADVPYGSAFYSYVETAYANGIISGYTCGSPGEPCDPQNRPYFRPGLNVTRGQLAKIVVGARHWSVLNPATRSFEDVPSTNPFYVFIETAVRHGVISGYSCGGPGEPCVPPTNRPYFRAFSTATRGQASKIIDLALYSNDITPTPTQTATITPTATDTALPTDTPLVPTSTAVVATATVPVLPTGTVVLPTVTILPPTSTATVTATATP
ncbi:MAG TPA: S-layer homology domain-containing protein [Chloroflexia bacterium]|nr:S-layer homology domain-containing protein [Chloroflexia bacterium]